MSSGGREPGRLGSLTTLLLRTLLDTGVTLKNVVVKYIAHTTVATLTCQSISASNPSAEWKRDYEVAPRAAGASGHQSPRSSTAAHLMLLTSSMMCWGAATTRLAEESTQS